jgi:hypothetical protein
MKAIPSPFLRKADASLDVKLNPVVLSSDEIVSWGVAFPRLWDSMSQPVAQEAGFAARAPQVWRTDATIGSVLGVLGRMGATLGD